MNFEALLPERSVEDILAERIRLVIGGQLYDLPVLTIRENRIWREWMDTELGYLVARLSAEDDATAILALFDGNEDVWMSLLTSYDKAGILPAVPEIEEGLSPMGLIKAVLEVWRAARPLADITRTMMIETTEPPPNGWRERMSSWRRRTAGPPGTSRQN